jgi:hypothetical protein
MITEALDDLSRGAVVLRFPEPIVIPTIDRRFKSA